MGGRIGIHRYKELDALRGIAALMVVFFHLTMNQPLSSYGFYLGVTGVDLFFLISGFVIYMSLSRVSGALEFAINRASRLYPTYWACVFLTASISLMAKPHAFPPEIYARNILGSFTMFQHFMGIPNIDYAYWTMTVELMFYITMGVLLVLKLLRHMEWMGWLASLVAALAFHFFPNHAYVVKAFEWIPLLSHIPLFLAGIIFHKIASEGKVNAWRILALISCVVFQLMLFRSGGQSRYFMSHLEYGGMLTIYFALFGLMAAQKLGFIVSTPSLFLGRISFAMYLLHTHICLRIFLPILKNDFHLPHLVAALAICLPFVVVTATIVTLFVGDPLQKRMKSKLNSLFLKKAL